MSATEQVAGSRIDITGLDADGWTAVCRLERLTPDRGVAALVEGRADAIFLLADGSLHAIDNIDPISGASILSRGLIGDVDGTPTVASPMFKQRFDLTCGRCIDAVDVAVQVHDVGVHDDVIHVRLQSSP
jgi:nitrite reductase (NADH) small subunit